MDEFKREQFRFLVEAAHMGIDMQDMTNAINAATRFNCDVPTGRAPKSRIVDAQGKPLTIENQNNGVR